MSSKNLTSNLSSSGYGARIDTTEPIYPILFMIARPLRQSIADWALDDEGGIRILRGPFVILEPSEQPLFESFSIGPKGSPSCARPPIVRSGSRIRKRSCPNIPEGAIEDIPHRLDGIDREDGLDLG
jgi:hypothetical protein